MNRQTASSFPSATTKANGFILSLDTASTQMAIALGSLRIQAENKNQLPTHKISLIASADQAAPRQANVKLMPAIDRLLHDTGLNKSDLTAVVSGLGPGSFTGVRIALASAKGIARGLGVPLFGVSTLDAIAWQAWAKGLRGLIAVVADAMRNEVYPARFNVDETGVSRLDTFSVSKVEQVYQRWVGQGLPMTLLGDGLYKYADFFTPDSSGLFSLADQELWPPTGSGLLLAYQAVLENQTGDISRASTGEPGAVLPIYTRLSDAEENERIRLATGGPIAQGAEIAVPVSGVAGATTVAVAGAAAVAVAGTTTVAVAGNDSFTNQPQQPRHIHFRPLAMQDVPLVAELASRCFSESPANGERWSESAFQAELSAVDRIWWVAWQDQQLVGYVGGWLIDGNLQVLNLAVEPTARCQGIGQELMIRLLDDGRALGAESASLEVRVSNSTAIALYQRLGFNEQGRRPGYYRGQDGAPREDALILNLSIFPGNLRKAVLSEPAETDRPAEQNTASTALKQLQHARPVILAFETSCDETAAAVIDGQGRLLSNVVASQVDYHARFGGVVPEIASRKHTEAIVGVADQALELAGIANWDELDALSVTYAPGLIGALVVGVAFAKGLSWATGLPLVHVNHLEGHIYANRLGIAEMDSSTIPATPTSTSITHPTASPSSNLVLLVEPQPPFVVALLSGGHTMLVEVKNWGVYRVMGQTLDDAVGEAFDKIAKALGLGYPGGPVISRLAVAGDPKAIDFPRALLHSHDFSFSLSGLKTAVISWIRQQQAIGETISLPDVAASFQQAVIDVQVAKALAACQTAGVQTFCLGGGVAANQALRAAYSDTLGRAGIQVFSPPLEICSDNAAMIAAVALDRFARGLTMPLHGDASAYADLNLDY
ncbi:MAG: tRNA (adenosine(37)-N6)-threonylcarbamoyltransferase complex dimerization subunit type 1 TsaB [Coriobacteriales bacterium]|jgi:N6-L-threonylcarbamoyladenine synthase|nr:tRNA (adenosine(37)-N6)-threonylcarbamoyltransferase complex dimerization subunit type 1 TsaB [Coriobacteriales bacterium]